MSKFRFEYMEDFNQFHTFVEAETALKAFELLDKKLKGRTCFLTKIIKL